MSPFVLHRRNKNHTGLACSGIITQSMECSAVQCMLGKVCIGKRKEKRVLSKKLSLNYTFYFKNLEPQSCVLKNLESFWNKKEKCRATHTLSSETSYSANLKPVSKCRHLNYELFTVKSIPIPGTVTNSMGRKGDGIKKKLQWIKYGKGSFSLPLKHHLNTLLFKCL